MQTVGSSGSGAVAVGAWKIRSIGQFGVCHGQGEAVASCIGDPRAAMIGAPIHVHGVPRNRGGMVGMAAGDAQGGGQGYGDPYWGAILA